MVTSVVVKLSRSETAKRNDSWEVIRIVLRIFQRYVVYSVDEVQIK